MAVAAGFTNLASQLELPDLLRRAEEVRAVTEMPGFKFLVDSVHEKEQKAIARLINETTKPEDLNRLQGLVNGLRCIHEAAASILALAETREAEANRKVEQPA